MKPILIFLLSLLALSSFGFGEAELKLSYEDTVKIDLNKYPSNAGADIWLSKDEGKTWFLIGKTFSKGGMFNYIIKSHDIHSFHIHPRSGDEDGFKPSQGAQIHEKIKVAKLENINPDILYSNRRTLSIAYDVMDATQKTYEGSTFQSWLYYTENSGLSWNFYAEDTDKKSPIEFVAKKDGLFGFKVISSDIAGQKAQTPGPGDPPDILVRIDTQAPVIRIVSPQPNDLWETGTTRMIKWEAKDEAMERLKSVNIFYSVGTRGNWKKLEKALPSSGEVAFSVPESSNGRIYLMASAHDKSGNHGMTEMQNPFFTRNVLAEMLDMSVREQADRYYETATICRKNRDFPKAIKYFRLCLQLNPYHVRAYNDLGNTFLKINEIKPAFQAYENGLKYSPSNYNILCNLSKLYIQYSQLEEAEHILSRVVYLYPTRPEGLWLMSEQKMKTGMIDQARLYWKRITDLVFPDASTGNRLQKISKKWLSRTMTVEHEPAVSSGILFNAGLE